MQIQLLKQSVDQDIEIQIFFYFFYMTEAKLQKKKWPDTDVFQIIQIIQNYLD